MSKLSITIATLGLAIAANAVVIDGYDFDNPETLEKLSKLTRAEVDALSPDVRRQYFKRTSELHSGGIIEKPGAGKGTFLFIDSTRTLTDGMFVRDIKILERTLRVTPKLVKGEPVTAETAGIALKELNANAAVFIVDNATYPRLVTASEEGWAIVNVGRLKMGAPSKESLEKRITIEVIRGLAQIFGCGNSGMSMSPVVSLKDIDDIRHPGFPPNAIKSCHAQMKKLGFEPKVIASYRVACQQGWAPPPTNDVQKAIWNKIHAIPATPMKIEFDPKKGR